MVREWVVIDRGNIGAMRDVLFLFSLVFPVE